MKSQVINDHTLQSCDSRVCKHVVHSSKKKSSSKYLSSSIVRYRQLVKSVFIEYQ